METVRIEGLKPELANEVESILDFYNGTHADAVLLIARYAGQTPDATEAQIVGISPDTLRIKTSDGADLSLSFAEPIVGLEQVRSGLIGLLLRSRQSAGESVPLTRIERDMVNSRKLPTYVTRVAATRQISPNLREITFTGGLEGFRSIGPDQFLYVLVQRPGQEGVIRDGATMAELTAAPEEERPAGAYYTVRDFRPDAGEIDLWFVLHDHDGGVGGWAASAEAGDPAALWGPRKIYESHDDASELLLIGDETGLPAISQLLREHASLPARVIVETIDEDHVIALPTGPDHRVEWVFRGATPPQQSEVLIEAVRKATPAWPEGCVAFGAAESSRILALRRHLRALGAPPSRLQLTPYWRSGEAS